jgi:hypothetical protein
LPKFRNDWINKVPPFLNFLEVGADLAQRIAVLETSLPNYKVQIGKINVRPLQRNSYKLARMMLEYRDTCT